MTRPTLRLTALLLAAAAVASSCAGKDTNDDDASSATIAAPSAPASTAADGSTAAPAAPATTAADGSTGTTGEAPTTSTAVAPDTTAGPSPTTPAAAGEAGPVTWATYREVNTLDPIYAFDYPENTVIYSMCESLLWQQPDGSIEPGITTLSRPDDKTMVFTVRDGVTFWDGSPLTADDIVFSLKREMDPTLGGFYGAVFARVASIKATAPNEVTIALSQPDYFLEGELASTPGIIVSKAFVEAQGAAFGTPDGGTMCTGPFQFDSWSVGDRLTVTKYDGYWNGPAKAASIDFVGVPDENTLTSGLLSGDIDGSYIPAISTIDRLASDPAVTVTDGPSFASAALIISNLSGTLADVNVRTALSMAIDREGVISAAFHGKASLPRAIANPGTWGYAPSVFSAAWDALPEPTQDIEGAKAMVEAAGATGKPLVLATSNELAPVATMANAVKAAAEEIGLTVELRPVSAANYVNLFIDPSAREGIDGFITVNYPDYADPAALYATFGMPDGSQNFNGYSNDDVTALFDEARTTADPAERAKLVTQAQVLLQQDLPWIGIANPDTVLVTNADLTGAPASFTYMFSPWPAGLGGTN
jgi:peptide/nickel transport system substrate-binding protein